MNHLLTLGLLLFSLFVRAQTAVSPSAGSTTAVAKATPVEKAVMDAEKRRFDAQVAKNYAVLEQVLANDLIYTHSTGNTDTKQAYIQSIRDGKLTYDAIDVQEQKVRVYGNSAVINGVCRVKATNNGELVNTRLRYTDVYVKNGNQWQMVTWQSLKLVN